MRDRAPSSHKLGTIGHVTVRGERLGYDPMHSTVMCCSLARILLARLQPVASPIVRITNRALAHPG